MIYICHYCIEYMTDNRGDMKKHFLRKNKCKCLTTLSYENAKDLTLGKSFLFTFDRSLLNINDYIFIVTYYNNIRNIININFRKERNKMIDDEEKNDNKDHILENEIEEENKKYNNPMLEEFDKIYYNKNKKCYICPDCLTEFTRKYNLLSHIKNKRSCLYKQNINKLIYEAEQKALIKAQKEKSF